MTAALTEHTGAPPDRLAGVPTRVVPAPCPPWFPERDEAEHHAGGPAGRITARAPVEPGTGVPRRRRAGRVAEALTGATRTRRGGRR